MIKKLLGHNGVYGPFLLVILIVGGLYLLQEHRSSSAPVVVQGAAPLSGQNFTDQSEKLRSLMEQQGISAAFAYVAKEVQIDPSFSTSCHPLLHTLGSAAYSYYGGYSQAIKYQNEMCNSGYTHGVLETYLSKNPDLKQAIGTACGTSATQDFDQWQCFHGLGHGIMIANNENIPVSTKLCNSLQLSFARTACVNGVFMEHFVVEDHDGQIPAVNPTSLKDCVNQPAAYKSDCYFYAPTAYLTVYSGQYTSALKWCNGAGKNYSEICAGGVGSEAMKDNITKPAISRQVCLEAPKQFRDYCVSSAVSMYIFYSASSAAARPLCQNEFANYKTACMAPINGLKSSLQI